MSTMTMNTAYELQKSRGVRNRNHLVRQKEMDGQVRDKKEFQRQRKIEKKAKMLRQLTKPNSSYDQYLPSQADITKANQFCKNVNHENAFESAVLCLERKEKEIAQALEEGIAIAEEDLIFVEDFVTIPARVVCADEWELIN